MKPIYKQNLINYIEKDELYQKYLNKKLKKPTDFEKFCVQHCQDIQDMLDENEKLMRIINKVFMTVEKIDDVKVEREFLKIFE